jgi:sulfite exporter TauE/SafE
MSMPPAGFSELSIFGGFLAGLASSLHCVGMCGGIASGLMFSLSPNGDAGERTRAVLLLQLGRIISYILAGALLGAVGSQFYFLFDRAEAHLLLRWLGSATLVYIGLSVAGWAPSLIGLDRVLAGVGGTASRAIGGGQVTSPVLAGMIWGFLPCGMVYAALFYAMLAGDAAGSAAIMAGFGLGTVPAVVSAAFGMGALVRWAEQRKARLAIALTIIALGTISAILPWRTIAMICGIEIE